MPPGNGKPNSLVEWVAGQNMPKKKTKSLRPLLSATIDIVTDDVNKKDYVAVGFPHSNSPVRFFDRGQTSSKKVSFNSTALRHSADALSLLADSSGGEYQSDYDSDDNVAPSKALVKPRKSSFKQGKERNTVDTDTSEGETGHGGHGMSPHPNCDCILCAAGRSLMRELGKGGSDHTIVANAAKKGKAAKGVESDVTAGETTTAGEESEPQPKGKGKKGKGGGGGDQQNQEQKDDGAAKKDSSNDNKKDEAKKNNENKKSDNENKKSDNDNKKNDNDNKKDGDNSKKGDQGKGDQGKQNNKQEAKGNPPTGNTPLPYRGSPNSRIILPVRQQTVHLEHAIEDTAKDHPPNAYMDMNRNVCRMYHGSEWGTHRKPHPSHSCANHPPTPSQNMASMYPTGPYMHGMPPMPNMYAPQVLQQPAYGHAHMMYPGPHAMYQPAYIPAPQQQVNNQQTAQPFFYPQMHVPQLHPSYGVYPPYSQPGVAYPQPGAMWGAPAPANPGPSMPAAPAAPAAPADPAAPAAPAANAGLSGMSLSGLGPSLSGLPNGSGEPAKIAEGFDDPVEYLAKFREERKKLYPNGIPGFSAPSKAKSHTGSVKAPSKPATENGVNGNGNDTINGYHWDDKKSNGGADDNNTGNDNNNSGENQTDTWNNPAKPEVSNDEWLNAAAPAENTWDADKTGWNADKAGWDAPAATRYDASQSPSGDPDTVDDNRAGHMPGSWDWTATQSSSQSGSPHGAGDSGYYTHEPIPADHNRSTWNDATTSMLSSFGLACRSTLSAAKETLFGASSGDTGVDNGETQDEWNDPTVEPANGTAQDEWNDPTTSQQAYEPF